VGQFGDQVLALPDSGDGINWAVYVVPGALVAASLAGLAIVVPRWRRRSGDAPAAAPKLSGEEQQRLERELARLD